MSVVERPDYFPVEPPTGPHQLIKPFECFHSDSSYHDRSALVLLNQPFTGIDMPRLWANCSLHVCADGGANQLYNYFDAYDRARYIPEYIVGDFDSLSDAVRDYYLAKGSIIIQQSTQYATDFTKSLLAVELHYHSDVARARLSDAIEPSNGLAVLRDSLGPREKHGIRVDVVGGIGGRFDQTVHSMNQLFKLDDSAPHLHLFFITDSDVIFLLHRGINYVVYDRAIFRAKTPICGLLPLGGPTVLNTQGLKYDVSDWNSDMTGDVSSSNAVCGSRGFVVDTTERLIMNVAYA